MTQHNLQKKTSKPSGLEIDFIRNVFSKTLHNWMIRYRNSWEFFNNYVKEADFFINNLHIVFKNKT